MMNPLFIRLSAILLVTLLALSACAPTSSLPAMTIKAKEMELATAVTTPTATPPQAETEIPQLDSTEEIIDEEKNMPPPSETLTIAEPGNTLPNDENAQKAVELAQKSLAKQINIAIEDITFLSYQPKTWPDGSMGCRKGGKMYTPVEILGYIIRLQVEEDVYEFHGGMGRRPFLCQTKALKDTKPGEITVSPPINE